MLATDMQAGLGRSFSMLLHPGAELTLLAPSDAAFQLLGFNSTVLPPVSVAMHLSETWVLQHPVNTAAAASVEIVETSLLGQNVTFSPGVNETTVATNCTSSVIVQADIPACRSWVHKLGSVLGL
jgi:hypothetical protein